MTLRHLVLSRTALLSAALLAFACGGDPNKQANDAHDAELKSERKQAQNAAETRSDVRVDAAETQRDAADANAQGSSATKDRTRADAKLTEARDAYRAKATARLDKVDARASELKALIDKAGGKASTASRDSLQTVSTQRAMVARDLGDLPRVPNDGWDQAKERLDGQLDSLEGLVAKTGKEVESFKK